VFQSEIWNTPSWEHIQILQVFLVMAGFPRAISIGAKFLKHLRTIREELLRRKQVTDHSNAEMESEWELLRYFFRTTAVSYISRQLIPVIWWDITRKYSRGHFGWNHSKSALLQCGCYGVVPTSRYWLTLYRTDEEYLECAPFLRREHAIASLSSFILDRCPEPSNQREYTLLALRTDHSLPRMLEIAGLCSCSS
jgi:hypothetical protein